MKQSIYKIFSLYGGIVLLLCVYNSCHNDTYPSIKDCNAVITWIKSSIVAIEEERVYEVPLPSHLKHISVDGKVSMALLSENRYCILLKSHIGWKDNYKGTLFIKGQIKKSEMGREKGQLYFSLTVPPFEEIYIEKKIDNNRYLVFFDLN
jgi:hypothetical protein